MYFVTYNCSGFTEDKIDYIKRLLENVHVLFLQELWLIDSHCYKVMDAFPNCNVFAVSGVHDVTHLQGLSYGGCAIIIRDYIKCKLTCVQTVSNRIKCVLMDIDDICIMLTSIYMPCDTYTCRDDIYDDVLSELQALRLQYNPMYFVSG